MNKYYTGVGSRETPKHVLNTMFCLATELATMGYTLRSGGAMGADTAFERGCDHAHGKKEIYLPWEANQEALELAASIHPAWDRCSEIAKKLHARNCFQVLGKDLKTPSLALFCWTKGGLPVGGTRTAIILANRNNIPVFNLANPDCFSLKGTDQLQIEK